MWIKGVVQVCIDILKDSPKSLLEAKKKRDIKKTVLVLVQTAVIFAAASGILVVKAGLTDSIVISSVASVFITILIAGLLSALVIHVATSTLGGKGKFFEGITAVSYSFVPMSAGVLVAAILTFVPYSSGIQLIVLAVGFSQGLATLYRGVKELYSTDMLTSFVALSVAILAIILAVYASVGLALIGGLATVAPVV